MDDSGLDYLLKFLLTIPIWFLLFRKLKDFSLYKRLLLHILLLPAFVLIWQKLYYVICEAIDFGHLGGTGKVWDIYIPALFYVLQFGIMHSYNYYRENQRKLILEGELRTAALPASQNYSCQPFGTRIDLTAPGTFPLFTGFIPVQERILL